MQNLLSRSIILAKHWAWAIILSVLLCGGTTFVVTTLMPRIYTAETKLVIAVRISPQDSSLQSSLVMEPTFNQLITSDQVLQPVAVKHGLTTAQLKAMVTTKSQSDKPVILVDVDNGNAVSAAQLSYEVTKSFTDYATAQFGTPTQFNIIKASVPTDASRPRPLQDAMLGGLAGLVLALAIVAISVLVNARRPKEN